jgi:tetratricopeptide (TPR) repeat protein
MRRASIVAACVMALSLPCEARASSSDELVASARRAEAAHEDEVAIRRYTEALALDGTHEEAWLALGALRTRLGDVGEAERVYSACIARLPGSHKAHLARADALHTLGRLPEAVAEVELVARADPGVRRRVAGYYMSDGLYPAALAAWRALLVSGLADGDEGLVKEARAMVRALVLFAKPLDPAAYPASTSRSRFWLGTVARRGG